METTLDRVLTEARRFCVEAIAQLRQIDRADYREWEKLAAVFDDIVNELAGAHVRGSGRTFSVGTRDHELETAIVELDGLLRDAAVRERQSVLVAAQDPDAEWAGNEPSRDAYSFAEAINASVMVRRGIALDPDAAEA